MTVVLSAASRRKIIDARARAGMTMEGLADKVGVSRQAVYLWESGRGAPSPHHIKLLLSALGLRPGKWSEEETRRIVKARKRRKSAWSNY